MVQETLDRYRSTKMDVGVMSAVKASQDVIDQLREKANIEDFEELVDKQAETNAERDELTDLLAENGITEDDIESELRELEAEISGEVIEKSEIPTGEVKVPESIEDQQVEREQEEKKQVVVA